MRATFEVTDVFVRSDVPVSALPSKNYVLDFDLALPGRYTEVGGKVFSYTDAADSDRFFVSEVQGNYVSLGFAGPAHVESFNLGVWSIGAKENVWSGGSFKYQTRVMLVTQSDTDMVQIDGLWADVVPLSDAGAFLTPNAMWTVYDTDRRPNGSEYFGSYSARLISLTAVPEPATLSLLIVGLVVVNGALRRLRTS